MLFANQLVGFNVRRSTGGGPSLSFLQGVTDGTDTTTYTYSSQSLGSADSNRWIIVCVSGVQTASRTLDSVSVGGVSATKIVQSEHVTIFGHISIWGANVPTGTTGDIVTTWSSAMARSGYSAYRLITSVNPTSGYIDIQTDNTLSGSDLSVSISSVQSGVIVAATCAVASAAESFTWTGASEDYDAAYGDTANQAMSSASASPGSTPTTVTVTAAAILANRNSMCAASFT